MSITIGNRRMSVHFKSLEQRTVGLPMGLDTGSDFIFLDITLWDRVLKTVSSSNIDLNYPAFVGNCLQRMILFAIGSEFRRGRKIHTGATTECGPCTKG